MYSFWRHTILMTFDNTRIFGRPGGAAGGAYVKCDDVQRQWPVMWLWPLEAVLPATVNINKSEIYNHPSKYIEYGVCVTRAKLYIYRMELLREAVRAVSCSEIRPTTIKFGDNGKNISFKRKYKRIDEIMRYSRAAWPLPTREANREIDGAETLLRAGRP